MKENILLKPKTYVGIDLFKLIAALLIVILHTLGTALGEWGVQNLV